MDISANATDQEKIASLIKDVEILQKSLDAFYQLMCGTFISLVQPGFALFEAGATQSKNAANIVLKNLLDTCVSAVMYYLVGYAFAYGNGNALVGLTYWAGYDLPASLLPHWYYQFIFANTAATIISGAMSERVSFGAYLTYSITITGIVYPIASCWVWNEKGWLKVMGFQDFSGSGVVHALGGTCSLVGAYLLGPRIGIFVNGKRQVRRGHSAPLSGIGILLIFTGFLAFNGGSAGSIHREFEADKMSTAMVNTAVCCSGAALAGLIMGRLGFFGSAPWPYFEIINAVLCGLVASCAGCDNYELWAALTTGAVAVVIFWMLRHAVRALEIDDPVDAIPTHLGSGFWGVIARPILGRNGIIYDPKSIRVYKDFGINLMGVSALVLWAFLSSVFIFGTLKLMGVLRATEDDEIRGNDAAKHGGYSYPLEAYEWFKNEDSQERRVSVSVAPRKRGTSLSDPSKFTNWPTGSPMRTNL